jgi:hypothetical protein
MIGTRQGAPMLGLATGIVGRLDPGVLPGISSMIRDAGTD